MHFIAHFHSSVTILLSNMVWCVWSNDHSIDDFGTYLFYFEAKLHHYTLLSDCHYHRLLKIVIFTTYGCHYHVVKANVGKITTPGSDIHHSVFTVYDKHIIVGGQSSTALITIFVDAGTKLCASANKTDTNRVSTTWSVNQLETLHRNKPSRDTSGFAWIYRPGV